MICDVLIIKDGLPLLSKSFSESSNVKNVLSEVDNLLMISGFFSALNSFSDSFEDLGTIRELKLSNNSLKLSFLKDPVVPDLIFLASYDRNSELADVQDFLKRISSLFLKEFDIHQITHWNGRLNSFKSFETVMEQCIKKEQKKEENAYDNQVLDWIKSFETNKDDISRQENYDDAEELVPDYFNFIPIFTTSKKINPKHYLTGDISCKVYETIDGQKNITQITEEVDAEQKKVYNICKNLVKMGFISFN
ncbi:MAG: hypothetical protein ACW986_13580 [Promethearchaeota archaeon]|jgi:hypothetical protein